MKPASPWRNAQVARPRLEAAGPVRDVAAAEGPVAAVAAGHAVVVARGG